MKKIFLSFIILALCLAFLPIPAGSAQTLPAPLMDEDSFTFAQLRENEVRLFGPFASEAILFGLPANWRILEGAQLQLDMNVAIQTAAPVVEGAAPAAYGGVLTVTINQTVVATIPLDKSGASTSTISIPSPALTSLRKDGRIELSFLLSSSEACLVDQKMDVIINSSSRFVIPHEIVAPNTNLANFPRPLYQDSIFPDSALIMIPDKPTAAELQAALTVAAGLQARTDDSVLIDVIPSTGVTQEQLAGSNLILVGNAGSLPLLYQLVLPMSVSTAGFSNAGDAGVLQMIVSPWSAERVVLVVSGNNDQATVKAAQGLSSGVIRPKNEPNLALISNVNSRTYVNQSSIDQTLAGLGYETVVFEGRGETSESFQFFIPSGKTVAPEAYFEVALNNSTLLNYARSGVFVTLNDLPIGSVRLSDDTANQFNNRIRIPIPPSTVRSGLNNLDVTAILEPREECADPNQGGLFVSLWSDSRLYLPLAPVEVNPADIPDLTAYPTPFMQLPELGSTAFILQRDNFESWRHAIKLAGDLGATSDGAIFTPAAFYADEVPDSARSAYNMLLIGLPSQLKLLGEINDKLPGPFEGTGDIASEKELQVIYEIDPEQSAGYLELVTSPWNQENLIIAVVGNSSQGLKLAAEALLNQEQRPKLLGDFAVVTNEQVIAIDTRLFAAGNTLVTQPTAEPPVSTTKQDSPTASRFAIPGNWLLIAMGLTFLIIVVVVGIALYARKKGK